MTARHHDAPRLSSRSGDEELLVAQLQALGARLTPSPTEDYRAAGRARLVAMAAVRTPAAGAPAAVRSPVAPLRRLLAGGAPRWRSRLTAGLAGGALAVGALGGVLGAAQGAAPGDVLYGVKRGGEQTQLALAGDATRGRTLLEFASTRLTELTALARDGATAVPAGAGTASAAALDADLVVGTLSTMDRQTTEGVREVTALAVASGDAAPLSEVAGWAAAQERGLADLPGTVPAAAGAALAHSGDLVTAVSGRVAALAAALGCATGPATAGADALGPLPTPCAPVPDRAATRDETAAGPATGGAAPAPAPAGEGAGGVTAGPGTPPAPAATTAPGPPAAGGGAPSPTGAPAATPTAPPTVPPGHDRGAGGRPAPGADRGGAPVPLPAPARPDVPVPPSATARPGTPPVVDLPVPLCVGALGLPIAC